MYKQISYILSIMIILLLGAFFYVKFCCTEYHQEKRKLISPKKEEKNTSYNYAFQLIGGSFNYSCDTNFNFNKEEFHSIKPVNKDIDTGIEKLKLYFEKNPNGRVIITGYALTREKNTSAFPSLGYARANEVKNYFITKGVAPNRFEIKGKLSDEWNTNKTTLLGPIKYTITNNQITAKAQDWKAKKEDINANPLIFYFNPNQSEITLNEQERQRISDLTQYLDNVPDAIINCIGYTDNTGDSYINIKLGQDRADFAKNYLIKNGINPSKIQTLSKGSDEPIADNLTPEGKAKNRRTVINLK